MDISGLIAKMNAIEKAVENGANNGIDKYTFLIEREEKKLSPIDTSRMRNSIYSSIDRGRMEGKVGPRTFYASYVIFGTGRYNVKGVRRVSGWTYTVSDPRSRYYGTHFTYGQHSNNFPEKAFNNQKENIKKIIKNEIQSAVRSIG